MTDRELMQQSLDALKKYPIRIWGTEAIKAIEARLAQCDRCGKVNPAEIHTCTPEYVDRRQWLYNPMTGEPLCSKLPHQESSCGECGKKASEGWALYCVECSKPMQEWVWLTMEEIDETADFYLTCCNFNGEAWIEGQGNFALAIEQILKEKNG